MKRVKGACQERFIFLVYGGALPHGGKLCYERDRILKFQLMS